MKRLGLLAIVIVGLSVIGCTPAKDKPSGGGTESSCCGEPDAPACCADKAKEGEDAAATGDAATEKEGSGTEAPTPGEGDTSAEPAGEDEAPPTEPDPAGLMDPDVDPTGPALGAPENKPDTSE